MKQFIFKRILLFLLCLLLLPACGQQSIPPVAVTDTWQEQYDLGLRYLSEGKYEEAILAFTAAIEIDPKQVTAHVGLGDAYVELENFTTAEAVLLAAKEQVSAEDIGLLDKKLAKLEELIADGNMSENGNKDSLQMPENLSGQAAFTYQDLVDWGILRDTTIWEVAEKFDYSNDDIILHLDKLAEMRASGMTGNGIIGKNGVAFGDDGLIFLVTIPGQEYNRTLIPVGPRGISIGMNFREVLETFMVTNVSAYEFLTNEARHEMSIYNSFGEDIFCEGKISYEDNPVIWYYEFNKGLDEFTELRIDFTRDGIVEKILIAF
jgi:Thioredoxin domain-containing protein